MNPTQNLIGKEFNNLTTDEMIQLVNACLESHKLNDLIIDNHTILDYKINTVKDVINYFEKVAYPSYILKLYFRDWTK